MRSLIIGVLFLVLATAVVAADDVKDPGGGEAAPQAPVLTLERAVQVALEGNPGIDELRARADALAEIPSQVGTLPDPRLSFNALNLPTDSFDLQQENMTQLQIGLGQTFPFPGKLRLREQIARLRADAAEYDVDELRLRLSADVRSVWWQLVYWREAGRIVDRNRKLMREFVEIASTKYEVGKGLQQDVLLAQLELSKLTDLAIRISQGLEGDYARLNALLDWPADRRAPLPDTVSVALTEPRAEAELQMLAEESRPLFLALQKQIDAADSAVALARRDYFPDLDVNAAYGFRSGDNPGGGGARADFASIRLSVSVPLFIERRQARAVDQRRAELLNRRYALADAKARIRGAVSKAYADYLRSRDRARLFRTGIIPQAEQTVASMLAAYQVSQVDFLNLVRAQITLYDYEMQYWLAIAQANQALAELEAAVGARGVLK